MRTPDNAAFFDLIDRTPLHRKILLSMLFDLHTQVNLILERRGMTRTELARKLAKSDAEVSKWFSGTHNLTLESVAKIAAALEEDIMVVPDRQRGYYGRASTRALAGDTVVEPRGAGGLVPPAERHPSGRPTGYSFDFAEAAGERNLAMAA